MTDKPHVYIIHNTEEGIECQLIRKIDFPDWIRARTESVRPECRPRFLKTFPTHNNDANEYLIFEGKVIIPKPIIIVESYSLEDT